MRKARTLIIGGGPSGLSLAYRLQGDTLILEKENRVGGLCRSIIVDGGVFDIGGHSFHTPHPEVYDVVNSLLPDGLYMQKREARVYSHGKMIPYPFQKYYDQIPVKKIVEECELGLQNAIGGAENAENFEDYIVRKFGHGIAKHFMLPYNQKLWACDISEISTEWTSERIASARTDKEDRFETEGGKRRPLQPDTYVGYPRHGGFEQIFSAFVPHLPAIELGVEVVNIDSNAKIVTASDGRQFQYDLLVSTIPIPLLMKLINNTPIEMVTEASKLRYMSLNVIMLLVNKRVNTDIQRIYVADPQIPPHKIAINHNSSDFLRRQSVHAIMGEVSYSDSKPLERETSVSRMVDFLIDCGIISGLEDIAWTGNHDVRFAYPVYTHDRPFILSKLKSWLRDSDIYTLGRFGNWEYVNSDKCIKSGFDTADMLKEIYGN